MKPLEERLRECVRIRRQLVDFGLGSSVEDMPTIMREFVVHGHGASGKVSIDHLAPGKRLEYQFSAKKGRVSYIKISST